MKRAERREPGRLDVRPKAADEEGSPGLHRLGLGAERDGLVYVPEGPTDTPRPLVVGLHGAGGDSRSVVRRLRSQADAKGFVVLAPESRSATWDVIEGGFGADVVFLSRALERVMSRHRIDGSTMAIEGFSDGASYALSLGITNGDLFGTIIALSPGFVAAGGSHGRPRVWVSHGTADRVLPIDNTSRRLAPAIDRSGFRLRYTEFEGGHETPEWLTKAAIEWWLGSPDVVRVP